MASRSSPVTVGAVGLVEIRGVVDETFAGFGDVQGLKSLVLDVSGMTRMTSFGVRQWLAAMERVTASVSDLYLLGCPTFFVDQLNMVLGFGGSGCVLTVQAPYRCENCGIDSALLIDVLAEYANLVKGIPPPHDCARCGNKLELDETPESYFGFTRQYVSASATADVVRFLEERGLYTTRMINADKPARVIKLVHGAVTYFRVIGSINSMFKARPFLVGAEGEIVIDLAEVDRFDAGGLQEWRRLLKTLSTQVPSVTIVDVTDSVLAIGGEHLHVARNIYVSSLLVPYKCNECGRISGQSYPLNGTTWPLAFAARVCPTCGGASDQQIAMESLAPLQKVSTAVPSASAKLIARRTDIISRAVTDANVAKAGDAANAAGEEAILGKYKIIRRLSAGGMAEVFLANQIGIGGFEKPVALKRIQSKLLETRHLAIDMFLNEAKIAGRLMHPNIAQVLDVGEVGGALYLAMEYVRGKDLRDVIRRLRAADINLPLGMACFIARELANALHHAYWSKDMDGKRLAVVHRDVTPHNVILSFDGQVKLVDFGVAMSAVTEQAESLIVGKWSYMSPEHASGRKIDHRSDLFSLGVVLYLLTTGNMPFAGNDPAEIMQKIRTGEFQPPEQAVRDIPPQLAQLITRMLAADPNARPQTGKEVAAALDDIMRESRLVVSAPQIASLLGDLFSEERTTNVAVEDTDATMKQTPNVAFGSASTARVDVGEHRSPVSFRSQSQSFGPGTQSQSLMPRPRSEPGERRADHTPTPTPRPVAASPRASSTITEQRRTRGETIAIVIALAVVVIAAVLIFVLVQPS